MTPKQILANCTHDNKCCIWLEERACMACGENAKRAEIAERGATPAESVLLACPHNKNIFSGFLPCCWNCSQEAKRLEKAARKVELDADKANRYRCCKCGVKPYSFQLAGYPLCGTCKKVAMTEHHKAVAAHGAASFLAMASAQLFGDKSGWAFSAFGSLKAWAAEQEKINPSVTL